MRTRCVTVFAAALPLLAQAEDSAPAQTTPVLNLQVLESRRANLGSRSIIFNRVVPPVLPPAPAPPIPPTAEQIAAAEAAALSDEEAKPSEMLLISATVYDRQVTEIRWFHGNREYRAFSNIDFNYVAGLGTFETAEAWYSVSLGLGNQTRADVAADNQRALSQGWPASTLKQVPQLSEFSAIRSEFKLVADLNGAPTPTDATAGIEALHRYFDANKPALITAYQRRLVEQAERERYAREHPPVPKDTVINYWPEKSRVYLAPAAMEEQP